MSRILRRPMFRGGRVDSRGTGIASGLGYAGGGSVNTPKRGLVNEPGGYAGEKSGMDFLKTDAPFWKKEASDKEEKWVINRSSDEKQKNRWRS